MRATQGGVGVRRMGVVAATQGHVGGLRGVVTGGRDVHRITDSVAEGGRRRHGGGGGGRRRSNARGGGGGNTRVTVNPRALHTHRQKTYYSPGYQEGNYMLPLHSDKVLLVSYIADHKGYRPTLRLDSRKTITDNTEFINYKQVTKEFKIAATKY